jgi:hypothetical protein
MAKPKSPEAYGVTVLKAPGGGLVIVGGPIDLSRAESLSPAWTRDIQQTRPTKVTSEPDNQGHTTTSVLPMLTKVGTERVHGESVTPAAKRLNGAAGRLLNAALLGKDVAPLELLEAMQRTAKPKRKHRDETRYDKWLRAERALDLLGKPDAVAARVLTAAGRTPADVEKYMRERAEFSKVKAA